MNYQRQSVAGWGSTVNTLYATKALIKWSKKYGKGHNRVEVALEVDTKEGKRAIVLADNNDQLNHVIGLGMVSHKISKITIFGYKH